MELLITLLLGLSIILGAFIANYAKSGLIEQLSVSVALGTMASLAVSDLLPEAFACLSGRKLPFLFLFIALGMIILKILDHFIPEHGEQNFADGKMTHIGITISLAIIVHNLIEGMAIYSVSVQSMRLGWLMALGVGLHNIPMGMIIFSAIKSERQKTKYALMAAVATSTFLGGLMMFCVSKLLNDFLMGALISLALGMIIYIVLAELLPYVLHNKNKKLSISGIAAGVAIMIVSSLIA